MAPRLIEDNYGISHVSEASLVVVGTQVEPKEKGQRVKDVFLDEEQPLEHVFDVRHLRHLWGRERGRGIQDQ